ncbi:universal stress protein [Halomicrococcus sp. SG-WS-1]|uniref:universal stress protein n=1 Tax=Halomicrococcus sp. SG-WS-1 TaxID=3439057 RepID=UPI003F7AC3C3
MKVLLGIGGSDDSLTALEQTVGRARAAGDDLTIAVLENPESDLTPDEVRTRAEGVLADADVDAEVRELTGDPGSQLLDVAESEGFDQIVLGGGQRSPMGKIKLGQIAEFVLLNSHVTVKLVREP